MSLWTSATELAPKVALFLAVVVGGVILSAIARRMTRWAADKSGMETLAEKFGSAKLLYGVGYTKGLAHLLGVVAWFVGLMVTASSAGEMIGITAVSDGVAAVIGFLPRLASAVLVAAGGVALAGLLRRIVEGMGRNRPDVEAPGAIAAAVYYLVIAIACVVAAGQAGINTELLDGLLTAVIAIGLAGVSLAFSLGSRDSFRNLVAGHFMKRVAKPGDSVVIGDQKGVVVGYCGVVVVLESDSGRTTVPCRRLLEDSIQITPSKPS